MKEQVLLLIVGGIIGFCSSVGMFIVERIIERKGRLSIFYKFICDSSNQRSWGIRNGEDNKRVLLIPTVIELQNTSNTARVIRDLCAELYNGSDYVDRLLQVEFVKNTTFSGGKEVSSETDDFGTNNGAYSFVLQPRSIQKFNLEFCLSIPLKDVEKKVFDKIILRYYDEKNKKHSFIAKTGVNGWEIKPQKPDKDWILLSKKL